MIVATHQWMGIQCRSAIHSIILAMAAVAILSTDVAAQEGSSGTRTSAPSVLEQRVKPAPKAPHDAAIPLPKPEIQPESTETTGIVLSGVQIAGATIYSESELAVIYEPYLGRQMTVAEIEEIVAAITAKYHGDGYILSRAIARPQDLDFGILYLDVIEGYIERVVFEGPMQARKSLLLQFAEKLKANRPLTQSTLERYVMLMSDLPGLNARPSLQALDETPGSATPGAHELILRLSHDAFQGYASVDNKSTRVVGRHITQLSGNFNSLFGQYGRTALYGYTVPDDNRELLFLEGLQEFTVNSEGTLVGIDGWHSVSESGEADKPLDLDSYDTRVAVYLVQPVIRGQRRSLFVTGTFEYRDTVETFAGVNNFDDRIRSVRLTARGFIADDWDGENVIIATASQGLDILDASDNDAANLSRNGGKVNYAKIEAYYTRYQDLPGPWSAELGLKGQLTSDGALSVEEFRIGGSNFGRAYDPSEISGDHGAAGYLEMQRTLAANNAFFLNTQIYAFYDLGAAWNDDPIFGTFKTSIASGGFSMRTLLPNQVRFNLELAKPLTEPVFAEGAQGEFMRFFFGLNVEF